MKTPWLKFYPSDWRGDQALRICSLQARGLWMEMLCIMHAAEPYGHLLINGHPVTDMQIAALTGVEVSTVTALKTELETSGVYSRNSDGIIYSRRMTRDSRISKARAKAGKEGAAVTNSRSNENKDLRSLPRQNTGKDPGTCRSQNPSPDQDFKNPPLPPNGKHFGNGFDILNLISSDGLMDARSQAPGWDVQGYLAPIYNSGITNGTLAKPRNANKAFPAWCKSYTKGRRP